ncbi:MAG: hypothetical protein ACRY3E_06385 [Candidatus Lariskella arthropodorum]
MNKIAFISQSDNVMKSTLAATALEAVKSGLDVAVADLDIEPRTITSWMKQMEEYNISPLVKVYPVASAVEAIGVLVRSGYVSLMHLVWRATSATVEIASACDLIIQPTTPSKKDLDLAIGIFMQLLQKGMDPKNPNYGLAIWYVLAIDGFLSFN